MSGIVGKNLGRGSGIVIATPVGADTVSGASIVDDAIDSEHYADGSIDNAHIADDAIDSEHYADGSIDNAHIADDAIDSEHYADGSIDLAHLSADCVDGTKIADDAIDSEHYTDGSIDNAHIADDAIDSEHYAAGSIDEAHIADNAVTLAKMAGNTDGVIITFDASGDPVAVGPGSDGEVLTSTGAGSPPAFEAAGGGEDGLTNNSNTTWMTVSSDEQINMPLQPCVNAYNSANDSSTTGDGTAYTVELDTERFDQGGDHNVSTDTFTAPITGRYLIIANVANNSVASGHTAGQLRIWTSNDIHPYHYNPYAVIDSGTSNTQAHFALIADMDAADVCYLQNVISGGAKAVATSSGIGVSFMCVHLLA